MESKRPDGIHHTTHSPHLHPYTISRGAYASRRAVAAALRIAASAEILGASASRHPLNSPMLEIASANPLTSPVRMKEMAGFEAMARNTTDPAPSTGRAVPTACSRGSIWNSAVHPLSPLSPILIRTAKPVTVVVLTTSAVTSGAGPNTCARKKAIAACASETLRRRGESGSRGVK